MILPVKFNQIEDKIIIIREQQVILDSDVAKLYDVETKRINEAMNNNPEKFPDGYVLYLSDDEFENLRSKISTANFAKTRVNPRAFTEKGLYMLATILKSANATQTTIAIVETFAKIRALARSVEQLSKTTNEFQQKSLMQKGGEIISDLIFPEMSETETSIELNFALLKLKHTIKKKPKE